MKLGQWEIDWVEDGDWGLDGGMMFGRVPRVLWERTSPPDELNRVRLTCRNLVLRSGDACVLVDAGLGTLHDEKKLAQLAAVPHRGLLDGLASLGVGPEQVTHVLLTHLHFDHVGGCVRRDSAGALVPVFPNARHFIQKGEWADAQDGNVLLRRSYIADTFVPLETAGVVEWLDGSGEILPGLFAEITGGHCAHHQLIRVQDGSTVLAYPADLMPIESQINPAWVMGLDAYPVDTCVRRTEFLERAAAENWFVVLSHDPVRRTGLIRKGERGRFVWGEA